MSKTIKKVLIISGAVLVTAVGIILIVHFLTKSRPASAKVNSSDASQSDNSQVSSETPSSSDESGVSDGSSSVSSAASSSGNPSSSVPVQTADNGINLIISSPKTQNFSTTDPEITFTGTSDPKKSLTVNGSSVERSEKGLFNFKKQLAVGKNTFVFKHKGETKTYTITYRYVIIDKYAPKDAKSYTAGSTVIVSVSARRGSNVTAAFNGHTAVLTEATNNSSDGEFITYNTGFVLPRDANKDSNLGKITYTATHGGKTESFSSGEIICKKPAVTVNYNNNVTPDGGKYTNVGSGYIAEIVDYNAETFDSSVSKFDNSVDWSSPLNNYLPKGTMDYCSSGIVSYELLTRNDKTNDREAYATLRAGYRVYLDRKDNPNSERKAVIKQYAGTLPDHNELTVAGFTDNGNHTLLTLNTMWKAPFRFELANQSYNNPAKQDYTISNITYDHIDITFCYASVFGGEITIPENNPLFSSAQLIKNASDYTLRLTLKKQGAFYGWDSYYNTSGQLCFEFLDPKTVSASTNAYGVNLNGAKILIDVGHGGIDTGAPGFDVKNHSEAIQNLYLANKIKAELESIGAQVYMTRTGNTTSSTDDKITLLKKIKPDYCIAIHHNSSENPDPNGFGGYYFNAFSKKAAEFVYSSNAVSGIYKSASLQWHYYYTARTTNCPVVLTENGYISNPFDYQNITNDAKNIQKAKIITKGIADYFKSIQNQ